MIINVSIRVLHLWRSWWQDFVSVDTHPSPVKYVTHTCPVHYPLSFQPTQNFHCSDGNFTEKGTQHIPQLELAAVQISKPRARFSSEVFLLGAC